MDFEFIERVVRLVEEAEIGELEIEQEGLRIAVKKTASGIEYSHPQHMMLPPMGYPPAQGSQAGAPAAPAEEEDASIDVVKAPMVGTFYRAPSPESPPYVEVGTTVQNSSVVCILEAMKVMNEIKAGLSGTITEVLVENGQAVEYGQALFKIKKS